MQYQRSERDLRRLTDVYKLCWFYRFIEINPLVVTGRRSEAESQPKLGYKLLVHLQYNEEPDRELSGLGMLGS